MPGVRLHHLAIAVPDIAAGIAAMSAELGVDVVGPPVGWGVDDGYRWAELELEGGEKRGVLELIEPWPAGDAGFLDRFLARHGPGPHHLMFQVDDLPAVLRSLAADGIEPIATRELPWWKEAFLAPNSGFGTVIQFAEGSGIPDPPPDVPIWWDLPAPQGLRVALRAFVLRSEDPDAAGALLRRHTGGLVVGTDTGVEVSWPAGPSLILEPAERRTAGVDRVVCVGSPARRVKVVGTVVEVVDDGPHVP